MDDLILTRESDDNMKDLAGNAMACTVVGSCIAHSLVLAMKHNVFELPKEDLKRGSLKASSKTQGGVQGSVPKSRLSSQFAFQSQFVETLRKCTISSQFAFKFEVF